MNFEAYINQLQNFLKENPHLADAEVVYSHDDEGNAFQKIFYSPSEGLIIDPDEYHVEFISKSDEETFNGWKDNSKVQKAVCIN
jgi:hypothetical protein